jgi:hypothetical protein
MGCRSVARSSWFTAAGFRRPRTSRTARSFASFSRSRSDGGVVTGPTRLRGVMVDVTDGTRADGARQARQWTAAEFPLPFSVGDELPVDGAHDDATANDPAGRGPCCRGALEQVGQAERCVALGSSRCRPRPARRRRTGESRPPRCRRHRPPTLRARTARRAEPAVSCAVSASWLQVPIATSGPNCRSKSPPRAVCWRSAT